MDEHTQSIVSKELLSIQEQSVTVHHLTKSYTMSTSSQTIMHSSPGLSQR